MPAVDEMKMVAARQLNLTYYGRQRYAADWGYCCAGEASLREVGGGAECRAVMFNKLVDDDERLKVVQASKLKKTRRQIDDRWFLYIFFFCCCEDYCCSF